MTQRGKVSSTRVRPSLNRDMFAHILSRISELETLPLAASGDSIMIPCQGCVQPNLGCPNRGSRPHPRLESPCFGTGGYPSKMHGTCPNPNPMQPVPALSPSREALGLPQCPSWAASGSVWSRTRPWLSVALGGSETAQEFLSILTPCGASRD
jgi:hypothetical protein